MTDSFIVHIRPGVDGRLDRIFPGRIRKTAIPDHMPAVQAVFRHIIQDQVILSGLHQHHITPQQIAE